MQNLLIPLKESHIFQFHKSSKYWKLLVVDHFQWLPLFETAYDKIMEHFCSDSIFHILHNCIFLICMISSNSSVIQIVYFTRQIYVAIPKYKGSWAAKLRGIPKHFYHSITMWPLSFWLRSGTVRVEDVDSYEDSLLQSPGEIGIILDTSAGNQACKQWIDYQNNGTRGNFTGTFRGISSCKGPCPPTFNAFRRPLISRSPRLWISEFQRFGRFKSSARPGLSYRCVFTSRFDFPYDECCYHPTRGYLIENPIPGAGRVHLYHPGNPSTIREFEEEEAAYNDCCSEPNNVLCGAFYSLRPVCTSDGWALTRPRWGKSDHWRSQPDNLVPLCKFQSITIIHFFRNWFVFTVSQLWKFAERD